MKMTEMSLLTWQKKYGTEKACLTHAPVKELKIV